MERRSVLICNILQVWLWQNVGFNVLRNRPELDKVGTRDEPTVIRASVDGVAEAPPSLSLLGEDWSSKRLSTKVYASTLDYHAAYKLGKVTPTAVAKALLPLIRREVQNVT